MKLDDYCNAIRAHYSGQHIEVRKKHGTWLVWKCDPSVLPIFQQWDEFRIKKPTIKYRVALMKCGDKFYTRLSRREIDDASVLKNFVRWLTPWVEVDLE